jgi:phosphatidylethanolamine/phosphatidyl-N-methylethanolamine N-methyltransferase
MFRFTRRALQSHHEVGAFCPSGSLLARKMTKWMSIEPHGQSRRVLEVGAGTGPFTREILKNLKPGDCLDVVELQADFCEILEQEVLGPFRSANPDITVKLHNRSILDAQIEGPYDDIICGLPFNIFPVKDVDDLFECMLKQLSPSGHLVYFAYMGMTKLKWPFIVFQPRLRKSLLERRKLMHQIHSHCGATRSMVLRNLPPAWACSLSALPTKSASLS